ncbi:uncharacterized protein LOC113385440 isoform X2 [Ctenocephalides felis]|uniref:uncharacterized protein LOC113385440 isoform X2 n=1 Tax=Ctenocephalides felis TaxID=7515 RepID=UPI000E6E2165|nr:uncharacterized protein LOC113385440 isoform X2 [Ctenocephalides felis]
MRSADERAISRSDSFPPANVQKTGHAVSPKRNARKITTTTSPHFNSTNISNEKSAFSDNLSIKNNSTNGFYDDLSRRDSGKFSFSEPRATVVCLNDDDKLNFEKSRKLGNGHSDDGLNRKQRCGAKTPWCHLGRLALVALCVAAICAIAPSAHARHAQQAEAAKIAENETSSAAVDNSGQIRIETGLNPGHHRNGHPGGQRRSKELKSEEIRQSIESRSGEVVSNEDEVVGRGLVSSSAALDTSGSTPDVASGDATNSGGELIADDVTRRDVTIDDVIKDEVKPWWKFASTACDSWRPPQHVYFQVTFLLLVLASCAPARGSRGCLWLRFMMISSSVALSAWALRGDEYMTFHKSSILSKRHQETTTSSRHTLPLSHYQQSTTPEGFHHRHREDGDRFEYQGRTDNGRRREQSCRPDALLWAAALAAVNGAHVAFALCRALRPKRFSGELEEVYQALFKPLKVTRHQFKKVLGCMKLIRSLKYQEVYAQEKVTKVDSLSLVLSGKLVVSQNQRALHIVFPHQFLDSPEWFGVSTDEYFQVSIMSMEESRVLIWHRDKLRLTIITDQFLQAVFDHILGRDVVKKLMQVSETMAVSNGYIPNNFDDQSEDKPMLILKKNGDGHGITALINRQLQEEHAPLLSRLCPTSPLVRLTVNPNQNLNLTLDDCDRTSTFEAFDKDNDRGYWS